MNRPRAALWVVIGLLPLLLLGCGGRGRMPPAARQPEIDVDQLLARAASQRSGAQPGLRFKDYNLIFVSFDALQAKHVGCLGYPRNVTPTLDAVARNGVLFTEATSVASWTVPASMTWFTGVYPSEHRMTNKYAVYNSQEQKLANLKELSPELLTLADVLRQSGYATGGFTGNAGVSGGFGYEQGFDVYYQQAGKFGSLDQSIPEALRWIAENRERKFFVFLHGYDVHGQNTPASGFDYRFVEPGYDRRFTGSEQEQEALREEGLDKGFLTLRDADVRFWRAVYDEKIQRTDAKFRQFLVEYEKLGLLGTTLFVLTSDHGTEFYEHRRFDHGFSLYQEQLHVPLILWLPGRSEPARITDRISSIDLMPTILDLLDVKPAESVRRQLRGQSLLPAVNGAEIKRDVFAETDYREFTFARTIIDPDGWKLIRTMENGRRELFDLNTDPAEQHDLNDKEPARADELERRLYAHYKSIGHDLNARRWERGLNPVYPSQGTNRSGSGH